MNKTTTTLNFENFEATIDELQPLLQLHWKELATHQDRVPLSPDYERYIEAEKRGGLVFLVLRQEGMIVGYFIGFLGFGLHYNTCFECRMDICFVSPSARGAAGLGLRMFRALEIELKRRGVSRYYMGSKIYADMSPIFRRIGAEPIETYFCKWIGE